MRWRHRREADDRARRYREQGKHLPRNGRRVIRKHVLDDGSPWQDNAIRDGEDAPADMEQADE